MGYINNTTRPTPQLKNKTYEEREIEAKKIAALMIKRYNDAIACLTDKQRKEFFSLSASDKLYVIENKKWPDDSDALNKLNRKNFSEYGKRGGRKGYIYLDAGRKEILRALGDNEMHLSQIHENVNGYGQNVTLKILKKAVDDGILTVTKRRGFKMYKLKDAL